MHVERRTTLKIPEIPSPPRSLGEYLSHSNTECKDKIGYVIKNGNRFEKENYINPFTITFEILSHWVDNGYGQPDFINWIKYENPYYNLVFDSCVIWVSWTIKNDYQANLLHPFFVSSNGPEFCGIRFVESNTHQNIYFQPFPLKIDFPEFLIPQITNANYIMNSYATFGGGVLLPIFGLFLKMIYSFIHATTKPINYLHQPCVIRDGQGITIEYFNIGLPQAALVPPPVEDVTFHVTMQGHYEINKERI